MSKHGRVFAFSLFFQTLALAGVALAQGVRAFEPDGEAARPSRLVVFEGFVFEPDGAPAEGAVVVSSAGGRAVTDGYGCYRLEAMVPFEAESVQVTVVGAESADLVASTGVHLSARSSFAQVEPLQLAQGLTCQPRWLPTVGGRPGMEGFVHALTVHDDGSGPALYAGGDFTIAGGVGRNRIARWEGSSWSALGSGMNDRVSALAVFDDGSGPALYAGGRFTTAGGVAANRIAKWDGSTWTPLGTGMIGYVLALTVFDDGSGPALYAGGTFSTAGGTQVNNIAKWDGASWTSLGSGTNDSVRALTLYDDGNGPALYAGGAFTQAGVALANRIAKWDGSSWSTLGSGLQGGFGTTRGVHALVVFDDGGGPALYAGGRFTSAGGTWASRIAKWDGSTWSALGSELLDEVRALAVYDDGSGPAFYAGGYLTTGWGGTASGIAKWDGSSWTHLGLGGNPSWPTGACLALAVLDDSSRPRLYAGGEFVIAGGLEAPFIANWDGTNWSTLGSGPNSSVYTLAVHDDGSGPALYAGGDFTSAGGMGVNRIGKWDGSTWSPLGTGIGGSGFPNVNALAVYDDGSGPALYAGGDFTSAGGVEVNHIAKWDGSTWSPLGSGIPGGRVNAMAVYDDGSGPALYVGGSFSNAGSVVANSIAKWNGSSWSALGGGMNNGYSGQVYALTTFDDGSGTELFAGGYFTSAGSTPANHIAKWDGSTWTPLGPGTNGGVHALVAYDDGSGPALYAGGNFLTAGGTQVNNIAKWDGSTWTFLGSGTDSFVRALTVYDDGQGPSLYAGGDFTQAGVALANRIAKWNGSSWSALGGGMSKEVHALAVYDIGLGSPGLFVGGEFTFSEAGDSHLAQWGCPFARKARQRSGQ